MKQYSAVPVFDEKTMSCLCDGTYYKFNDVEVDLTEDPTVNLTEEQLRAFQEAVDSLGNDKVQVVYEPTYEYYLIAYMEAESNQQSELEEKVSQRLAAFGIVFE